VRPLPVMGFFPFVIPRSGGKHGNNHRADSAGGAGDGRSGIDPQGLLTTTIWPLIVTGPAIFPAFLYKTGAGRVCACVPVCNNFASNAPQPLHAQTPSPFNLKLPPSLC